jgi:NAD(P)-dependent dehydrogenase (short-subunit alcohol dehydrogenase family)
VTIISSSQEKVDAAIKRLSSPNVHGIVGDVRNETAFVEVLKSLAPVDHIVFSGVDRIIRGKLEDMDLDEAKHLFGVKFWGAVVCGKGKWCSIPLEFIWRKLISFFTCIAVLKHDIIRPGGSLTLTSGMAALKPGKNAAVGGGLNGGVLSLTTGLASDLAEKKIRVNCVTPGLVQTELWDKQGQSKEAQKETFEKVAKTLPVGFVATSEHIAEAYLFCVRADYATGTLVKIGEFSPFRQIGVERVLT